MEEDAFVPFCAASLLPVDAYGDMPIGAIFPFLATALFVSQPELTDGVMDEFAIRILTLRRSGPSHTDFSRVRSRSPRGIGLRRAFTIAFLAFAFIAFAFALALGTDSSF